MTKQNLKIETFGKPVAVLDSRIMGLQKADSGKLLLRAMKDAGYFVIVCSVTTPTNYNGLRNWIKPGLMDAVTVVELPANVNSFDRGIIIKALEEKYDAETTLLLLEEPSEALDVHYFQYRCTCTKCEKILSNSLVFDFMHRPHFTRIIRMNEEDSDVTRIMSRHPESGAPMIVFATTDQCSECG